MLLVYKISARFAICFNCCQPLCVQPTAVALCVRSFDDRRMVCAGHSTIIVSSPQTTIVGPTKVAWCVPSLILRCCLVLCIQ